MSKAPLIVAGSIFALIALVHLGRLIWHFPIIIGTFAVPYWLTAVAFVIALGLSIWMFRFCCCCCKSSCDKP